MVVFRLLAIVTPMVFAALVALAKALDPLRISLTHVCQIQMRLQKTIRAPILHQHVLPIKTAALALHVFKCRLTKRYASMLPIRALNFHNHVLQVKTVALAFSVLKWHLAKTYVQLVPHSKKIGTRHSQNLALRN